MDSSTFVSLAFAIGGGYLAIYSLLMKWVRDSAETWPEVKGRVVESRVVKTRDERGHYTGFSHLRIRYIYQVNGRVYTAALVSRDTVAGPSGEEIRVRYWPTWPRVSWSERDESFDPRSLVLGTALALFGIAIWLKEATE